MEELKQAGQRMKRQQSSRQNAQHPNEHSGRRALPGTNMRRALLASGLALALTPLSAVAQNLTGEIDGRVQDASGAVVPNATVTIHDINTNTTVRTLHANGEGEFQATLLAIGTYDVTIEMPGFQKVTTQLELHANQPLTVPVTLQPGQSSTNIQVTESTATLQLDSPVAGTLINGNQVRQLPLSSRNYQQLLSLQPGISGGIPGTIDRGIINSGGNTNSITFSVNGGRTSQNSYFLDGQEFLNRGGNGQTAVFPSVDATSEINLLRNSYGAQYGGAGAAITSLQSKTGSTQYHGDAYEFFRSQVLNANNYFNNRAGVPKPGLRYNDFGYTFGGPVPFLGSRGGNQTFFFVSQEFLREESSSLETISNIPTAAQRAGTFATPVCTTYTGSTCTASSTQITNFNPTAATYLNDILLKTPLPNSPTDVQGLIAAPQGYNNESQLLVRGDHQFGDKLSIFFRYLNDPFHLQIPFGLYNGSGIPGVGTSAATDGGTAYLGHATYVLSDKTVIEGGLGFLQVWVTSSPIGLLTKANSPDVTPTLPFATSLDRVPNITIGGNSLNSTGAPYNAPQHQWQGFVNITHNAGRHTIYFGGQVEDGSSGSNPGSANAGAYNIATSAAPAGSGTSQFAQAFANFLEGRVTSFSQTSADVGAQIRNRIYEGYAQDDFHATQRLTLNAGVRYVFTQAPDTIAQSGFKKVPLVNFDPATFNSAAAPAIDTNGNICTVAPCVGGATPNPGYNTLNGLIVGGTTSPFGHAVSSQPNLNFAPRLGFAYDVFGDGTTSLRGGYGISYIQLATNIAWQQMAQSNPPNVRNVTFNNPSFSTPGTGTTTSTPAPIAYNGAAIAWHQPYIQTWSLDIQHQLPGAIRLDIGYYGSKTTHQAGSEDINQPAQGAYISSGIIPAASTQGTIPGQTNTYNSSISAGNEPKLNQIRPYRGYGPINVLLPIFATNYNALQTSASKRFADGSTVNVNYTFAKTLTNSGGEGNEPQNNTNVADEYGPVNFNRKHVFNANFVYLLPVFQQQHGFTGQVLGGWSLSGIVSYASGLPLTVNTSNVDPGGLGDLVAGTARPDYVSNPNSGAPHTLGQWFNTASYVNVPAGQFRGGNSRPGGVLGPGYGTWDLGLLKDIRATSRVRMQFRAEGFNIFNHTNYSGISTTISSTNYGQVTSAGQARVAQFALKAIF